MYQRTDGQVYFDKYLWFYSPSGRGLLEQCIAKHKGTLEFAVAKSGTGRFVRYPQSTSTMKVSLVILLLTLSPCLTWAAMTVNSAGKTS